jgi:hypothetical protein
MRIPPELWHRFAALVPSGERSGVIQRLIREEVERLEWMEKQVERRRKAAEE